MTNTYTHTHIPCHWHRDWISISFPICDYYFFRWCNLTVVVSCKCAIDKSKFNFYKSLSHFYLNHQPDMLSSIQAYTLDALQTYFSLWKMGNFENALQIENWKRIVRENRMKIEMINKNWCDTMYNSMRCASVSLFCSLCWCWCCRCHCYCHCCCLFCINVMFVSFFTSKIRWMSSGWKKELNRSLMHSAFKMDVELRCINKFAPRSNAVSLITKHNVFSHS